MIRYSFGSLWRAIAPHRANPEDGHSQCSLSISQVRLSPESMGEHGGEDHCFQNTGFNSEADICFQRREGEALCQTCSGSIYSMLFLQTHGVGLAPMAFLRGLPQNFSRFSCKLQQAFLQTTAGFPANLSQSACARACVYVCVCMYVCMYVCVHGCMYACM